MNLADVRREGHPGFLFAMIDGRQLKGRYMPFHSRTGYRSATEASCKLLRPGLMIIARYHQASRHVSEPKRTAFRPNEPRKPTACFYNNRYARPTPKTTVTAHRERIVCWEPCTSRGLHRVISQRLCE
jgi:hypothetical protein